jgi:hypothetical protein
MARASFADVRLNLVGTHVLKELADKHNCEL